jgi:hypothetical protein
MPGFIMLITKIIQNPVHGPAFVMSVLMVILWQFYGSVGITARNFWKFYLANIVGLVLFLMVFTYEQIFTMSLHCWFEDIKGALGFMPIIPMIGLFAGLLRENANVKPEGEGQGVKQDEKTNYMEKQ